LASRIARAQRVCRRRSSGTSLPAARLETAASGEAAPYRDWNQRWFPGRNGPSADYVAPLEPNNAGNIEDDALILAGSGL
jgi:hypothetical protein